MAIVGVAFYINLFIAVIVYLITNIFRETIFTKLVKWYFIISVVVEAVLTLVIIIASTTISIFVSISSLIAFIIELFEYYLIERLSK
jgi:hypothetical protein